MVSKKDIPLIYQTRKTMVTLKKINKQVQRAGYNVEVVSCKTYFMVIGVDDNWNKILNSLQSTSISAYRLNHMTLDRWVADVIDICEEAKKKYNG